MWLSALTFLLRQQGPTSLTNDFGKDKTIKQTPARTPLGAVDEQGRISMPQSPMSMSIRSFATDARSMNLTPKAQAPRTQSAMAMRPASTTGKRQGTLAHEYMRRHDVPATLHGGHRFKGTYKGAPIVDDFDVVSRDVIDDMDDPYEGLENVRGEWLISPGRDVY